MAITAAKHIHQGKTLNKYIMKLSEIKNRLSLIEELNFKLPNGQFVPKNFHVTEVGMIHKHFIDCGGVVREEKVVNFQLWEDERDINHRLKPGKLSNIIALSESKLGIGDFEIEVEYQSDTIGKYGLEFDGTNFLLTSKQTDCLAKDGCGIPAAKKMVLEVANSSGCCTPGGGCC